MFPKNLAPEEPPGIEAVIIQNNEMTCATAHITVKGVLLKCSAQYSVAIIVMKYSDVVSARSLENKDFMCAHGP